MVSLTTWIRYASKKLQYSFFLSVKKYELGQIHNTKELSDIVWKNFFQGKLTFLHLTKGEEMAPTVAGKEGTLLVRKMPFPHPKQIFVGDVIMLKDPEKPEDFLVRRLAAIEGYEMVSNDEKDEPFVLEKDQCWVVADNEALKPKEAKDSRLFGPVSLNDIVGRVIYSLHSAVDHGPVQNSHLAMNQDSPVLTVELDVEEMARSTKV